MKQLFKVNHRLQQKFQLSLMKYALPEQLTNPRLRVMMELSANGEMRMSELAKKLGINARTVTQFVDALERENYIVRIPDQSDRRATLLQLTGDARPLFEKAEIASYSIANELIKPLSDELVYLQIW